MLSWLVFHTKLQLVKKADEGIVEITSRRSGQMQEAHLDQVLETIQSLGQAESQS